MLENIFVAAFIKSKDVKDDNNTSFFQPLIDVCRKLAEQGVKINTGNISYIA